MATEIERKFLLSDTAFLNGLSGQRICQGYLSHSPEAAVRVRIAGEQGFLTIKGGSTGISRAEFEYSIPLADADALLALCKHGKIEKTRYRVPSGSHVWEIDVFEGDNHGLVVAEIELTSEQEQFERPAWLGEEVSNDPRYFNSQLSIRPISVWHDQDCHKSFF
ncbi:MAG: CYTH domain-containing protein [Alcanivoracaceae bacterium]|jgi:CYTH domain-containing protein|nr:CYTH domain-containing protein [Alcanivoracaceae bacterium]